MTSDLELLQDYARNKAEASFAALVNRHLNLVYSAALRQVRSPQLAEEVAQAVFMDLSQSAGKLRPGTILTAWLYQVTRRTAIDVVRREARRQLREQVALEMNAMNAAEADWRHIEPLLDDAMAALEETDRAAVLLRYFENKSLREVGATLGTSDDAAQKRVSRAVERLREFFAKRGVTVGASGLAVVISANAVQAAPVGLAVAISTAAALTGSTLATTATVTATKAIATTALQKTIVTATIAVLAGGGIYEARQASQLRDQVQALQQQLPTGEQFQELQREHDDAISRLAALREDNERLNHNAAELLRLRGEIGLLRNQLQQTESQSKWQAQTNPIRRSISNATNQIGTNGFPSSRERVYLLKDEFIGTLLAIDRQAQTVTIASGTPERAKPDKAVVYVLTPDTKIFKGEDPATLEDGVVGQEIRYGIRLNREENKNLLTRLRFRSVPKQPEAK